MPDETNMQPTENSAPAQPVQATVQDAAAAQAPVQQPTVVKSTSGMGIASMVLGILAILTSFLPIINNGSFVLALLGLVFAVVGIIATKKGKKGGRGIAIAGLVLNLISLAVVLATQSMYSAAFDQAVKEVETGSKPVATAPAQSSTPAQEQSAAASEPAAQSAAEPAATSEPAAEPAATSEPAATPAAEEVDYSNMALGETVVFKDGLQVSVDAVTTGLLNYDDSPITAIAVTYTNNSDKNQSFNVFDWKAEDANGVLNRMAYYSEAENELGSGQLTPGGSVTGNIYFDGDLTKVYYYENVFQDSSEVAWNLQ